MSPNRDNEIEKSATRLVSQYPRSGLTPMRTGQYLTTKLMTSTNGRQFFIRYGLLEGVFNNGFEGSECTVKI